MSSHERSNVESFSDALIARSDCTIRLPAAPGVLVIVLRLAAECLLVEPQSLGHQPLVSGEVPASLVDGIRYQGVPGLDPRGRTSRIPTISYGVFTCLGMYGPEPGGGREAMSNI